MNGRRLLLAGIVLLVAVAVVAGLLAGLRRGGEEEIGSPPSPVRGTWYEVLFTAPQRTGTPPPGRAGRLDERLVQLIDGAQRSIDVAAYDFGLDNVAEALVRAKRRGVTVRLVTDTDNLDHKQVKQLTAAGIPVVEDQRRAIMHHKFAVIDGQTVMTGAWNFAERDTFRHNNNAVVFQSQELARNFTNEFEKMFTVRRFGPTKSKDVPNPVVERDGTSVQTFFAAEMEVEPELLARVRSATSSVAFMAFSFTLDGLGVAFQDRVLNGVGVWGVVEATGSETQFSEFQRLRNLKALQPRPPFPGCVDGPAVLQDGNPFLMHHKVIVIDERTVIFGSFNFTANAAEDNDEALLIVDDPAMARPFLEEFCRVYNVAVERSKTRR